MATIFRWLIRIFAGLAVLAGLIAFVGYLFLSRSLPDYDGRLAVAGLGSELEIVRDNNSVPHIFGASDADAFFGLGFAHAQDRLWQMTLLRRTAQGRLSEVFGLRTLQTDKLMRRLDIYNLARQSVAAQPERTRTILDAYAAGVNAWLREVNAGARGRGAPEFFLFAPQIAPWQPADSIAILKLMGVQLSSHLETEVLRARLSLAIDDERVRDVMPDAPGSAIAALPEFAGLFPGSRFRAPQAARQARALPGISPRRDRAFAGASNVWAADTSRSATGSTLLANDPHLMFSAPTIWYLARLDLAAGGVIGGTIPGAPVVLAGRSERLGWGITSSYMDDQDVHIEEINPDNPGEVRTPGGFKALRTRSATIRVRDADPVVLNLAWSENGPILPGSDYALATITPPGHVASVAWTLLSPADTSITAGLDLMQAGSVGEALDVSEAFIAPSQNLALADAGTIAMKTVGAIPRRDENHQSKGRLPSPGWLPRNRWAGRMPYSDNPEFVAPKGGILGNTNNRIVDRPFPDHVSFDWGDSERIRRWRVLMQRREVHTRDSFIEAQLDTVSSTAASLVRLVGDDLRYTGQAAPEGTPERRRQRALEMLYDWNAEMNEHLPEPLIYAAWMRALQRRLIEDELGPLAGEFTQLVPLFVQRVFRDTNGASVWCDVVNSAREESCTDMARLALDDALVWIGDTYGTALESLRWGDAHEAAHRHPVLGDTPILGWLVNIVQSTSGGDNTLLRGRTKGTGPDPFRNVHGAGYRGVYDFADPDSSVFIIATGQSGHPLSRHYDDLGELWRRGEYIPMQLDPDLARAASVGTMVLAPSE